MLKTQEVGQSSGVTQEPRSPTRLRIKPTLPFEISPSSTSGFSPSSVPPSTASPKLSSTLGCSPFVPPSPASPKLSSTSGCSPSVPLSPASPKLSSTSSCSPSVPLSPVGLKLSSTSGPAPLLPLDLMLSSPSTSLFSSSKSQMPLSPPAPRLPALPSSPPGSLPSSPSSISILERLIKTCPVWLQLGITQERATLILEKEISGIFLVRKTPSLKKMVLSVRLSDQEGVPKVQDLLIKEEKSFIYLESSVLVFDDIFKLIAFYCLSRDILPFTLRLPQAIIQATRFDDMEMISSLGSGFWSSSLNRCAETRKGCSESPGCHCQAKGCSCEIELSAGNDRLWYVNPVFVGEYCNSLPHSPPIARSQSLTTPGQAQPRYKRPPPLPPRPHPLEELLIGVKPTKDRASGSPMSSDPVCTPLHPPQMTAEVSTEEENCIRSTVGKSALFLPCNSVQGGPVGPPLQGDPVQQPLPLRCIPPVPPRRRQSEKSSKGPPTSDEETPVSKDGAQPNTVPVATLICLDDTPLSAKALVGEVSPAPMRPTRPVRPGSTKDVTAATAPVTKMGPVPPPRRKWVSQIAPAAPSLEAGEPVAHPLSIPPETLSTPTPTHRCITAAGLISTDVSLYSPEGAHAQVEHDSYSTSSAEEEADVASAAVVSGKRNSSIMLDRAKQRLSIVNLSHIFTSFMSTDRKLKKRIVELALDRDSYMGNLVKDYKTFTLETMQKHSSSTEMLQEIRLMMTQLKNYLIQSTELQTLLEPTVHPEEKLEAIIEAALCKSVLKPLREAVFVRLRDIHTQDDSLKRLRDNQQVVLTTTTTDLGIITSVPEAPAMEKIQAKLAALHKEYSPEKKVSILLKTSKIIYESMSVGSAGKSHGADDFLPVLMYVLARSNTSALLLDVEYMMELMDPALQLGEGSYYLTTTYGALEHIKNYDKLEGTGQLSLEIQDSIHRWERRRTLNKARASRSTLQDFINVSFLEAGTNTKTLGVRPGTTTQDLSAQCAKKFDVMDPESYRLCVLVEGLYRPLAEEELPLSVKSSLHYSEPRKEYYFVYRPGPWGNEAVLSQDPNQSDNLI